MAEEVELVQSNAGATLQGQFIELEVDGKIVNFQIKSIGNHMKDTTNAHVVSSNEKGRSKTAEQIADEEKQEEIFTLMPDCM